MGRRSRRRLVALAAILAAVVLLVAPVSAATVTWNVGGASCPTGSSNWSTTGCWQGAHCRRRTAIS